MTQLHAGREDRTLMGRIPQGILSPFQQGEESPNEGRSLPQVGASGGRRPVRTVYATATTEFPLLCSGAAGFRARSSCRHSECASVFLERISEGSVGRERHWYEHFRALGQADTNTAIPGQTEDFPSSDPLASLQGRPAALSVAAEIASGSSRRQRAADD